MATRRKTIRRFSLQAFFLLALAIALPILFIATYYQTNLRSKAYTPTPFLFGNALSLSNEGFNDSYAYAASTKTLSTNPFTVETWLKYAKPSSGDYLREYPVIIYTKPQSPADRGYIFKLALEVQDQTGDARPSFSALVANGTSTVNTNYISAITGSIDPSFSMKPNTWYHVAATSSSEGDTCTVKLFINGTLQAEATKYKTGCQISTQQPQQLLIGNHMANTGGVAGYNYVGDIDELRISSIVKYNADFVPAFLPFVAKEDTILLYNFNEVAGATTFPDVAGITLMPGTLVGPHITFTDSTIVIPTPTPSPSPTPGPPSPTPTFTITVGAVPTTVSMKQPVTLTLRVTNHDGYDGKATSGFITGAAFIDPQTQNQVTSAGGTYNATTGVWSITLTAPSTIKTYKLEVSAECGNSLAWCAQTYGTGKKVLNSYTVAVTKAIPTTTPGSSTCLRMICPNGQKASMRGGKCSCQPSSSTQ